jgi:hypothetical protein
MTDSLFIAIYTSTMPKWPNRKTHHRSGGRTRCPTALDRASVCAVAPLCGEDSLFFLRQHGNLLAASCYGTTTNGSITINDCCVMRFTFALLKEWIAIAADSEPIVRRALIHIERSHKADSWLLSEPLRCGCLLTKIKIGHLTHSLGPRTQCGMPVITPFVKLGE